MQYVLIFLLVYFSNGAIMLIFKIPSCACIRCKGDKFSIAEMQRCQSSIFKPTSAFFIALLSTKVWRKCNFLWAFQLFWTVMTCISGNVFSIVDELSRGKKQTKQKTKVNCLGFFHNFLKRRKVEIKYRNVQWKSDGRRGQTNLYFFPQCGTKELNMPNMLATTIFVYLCHFSSALR